MWLCHKLNREPGFDTSCDEAAALASAGIARFGGAVGFGTADFSFAGFSESGFFIRLSGIVIEKPGKPRCEKKPLLCWPPARFIDGGGGRDPAKSDGLRARRLSGETLR